MKKNNHYIKYINRYWNYYRSNRSLLLLIIVIAALLAITVQAAVDTPEGMNVKVQFEDEGINITFAEVTKSGNTSVDTSSTGPDIPDGYDWVNTEILLLQRTIQEIPVFALIILIQRS